MYKKITDENTKKFRKINNLKGHCTKTVDDGKLLIAYLDSA